MKTYLRNYFAFLSLFAVFSGMSILYLFRVGEYTDLTEVVEKQLESSDKVIYGTALTANIPSYKRVLLEAVSPKVVILGSSRVMQFREAMFSKRTLNLGGVIKSINSGISLLPELSLKSPEVLILGLDIWWFNDRYQDPRVKGQDILSAKSAPKVRHAVQLYQWLFEGKLSLRQFASTVIQGSRSSDIGVGAIKKDGFGPDGSYYYTRIVTGDAISPDVGFLDTFDRIEKGNRRFEYNKNSNQKHIENIAYLIAELQRQGIYVVTFFPPFADLVNQRMTKMGDRYKYVELTKRNLKQIGVEFYDLTDVKSLGSDDCEFVDGFHGGDVTYSRILRRIGESDAFLSSYLNHGYISQSIDSNRGKAFIADSSITSKPEIDFLNLGCDKHPK